MKIDAKIIELQNEDNTEEIINEEKKVAIIISPNDLEKAISG